MRISFLRYDMQGAPSRHKAKLVPAREGLAPSKRYSTVELIVIGANGAWAEHKRSPNRGVLFGNLPFHQRRADGQDSPEDVGLDRSNESCGLANSTCVSGPGKKHCFSRSSIPKTTDDCRHRPIGLCADAQIEDDGPKMETYHEGTYRCSCVGHADCRPDVRSPRERGPSVPGQLIIRV